jgi:phage terminase small subunit
MARKNRQVVSSDKSDDESETKVLTSKQAAFVKEFTSGPTAGNAAKSIIAAGYETKNAGPMACAICKLPHITAAIDAALRREIAGNLTIAAVRTMAAILGDKNAPLKIKADCAAKVIEFSGVVSRIKIEKANQTGLNVIDTGPKRLGEMTRVELEDMVRNGAAILHAAAALPPAKPVIDASPKAQNASDEKRTPMFARA